MKDIIFIHGMFQNPKSWEKWQAYFATKGYVCTALTWPMHEGDPRELKENPPEGLGDLHLDDVVVELEKQLLTFERPIVIGHSVGGLITQLFADRGLIRVGIAISSVAPNRILDFDWDFIKNSMLINNPFKGNEPFYMDAASFHETFANTLDETKAKQAWESFATHDSRNILRDCMGRSGEVNADAPHVPLLFIGGDQDKIIPPDLVEKNAKAYTEPNSIVDYKIFTNRSHYICGEPGWEEMADYIANWINKVDMI